MMSTAKSIPDENTVKNAAEVKILDAKGSEIKFGSLFEEHKCVVVFIREHPVFLSMILKFLVLSVRSFFLWCKTISTFPSV